MALHFRRRHRQPPPPPARIEPTAPDTVVLSRDAQAESRRHPWRWFWLFVAAAIGVAYVFVRW